MASDSTVPNVNGGETGSLNGEPVVKRPRESGSQVSSLRVPKEPHNKVTVVLGAQWGDEGKGKVVDLLAMDADIVCRCQVLHDPAGFTLHFQIAFALNSPIACEWGRACVLVQLLVK